jgi:hypothetical protein
MTQGLATEGTVRPAAATQELIAERNEKSRKTRRRHRDSQQAFARSPFSPFFVSFGYLLLFFPCGEKPCQESAGHWRKTLVFATSVRKLRRSTYGFGRKSGLTGVMGFSKIDGVIL